MPAAVTTRSVEMLLGPGPGDGFNFTELDVANCNLIFGICPKVQWLYTWKCCKMPVNGNWAPANPYVAQPAYLKSSTNYWCPSSPFFLGCTEPNEILTADGIDCVNTTCPGLAPMASSILVANQTVVATGFESDVNALIACAKSLGPKTSLSVQSTARCGPSIGDDAQFTIAGYSLHQMGMAIDTNLVLPDGTVCDRNCMAQGYCAYHQSSRSCVSSSNCPQCQGQQKTTRNQWINTFFTCAMKIQGLGVGATFNPGDWNHFQREVANRSTAATAFAPQLKAFCHNLCPSKAKKKPDNAMCNCPGYTSTPKAARAVELGSMLD
ncbi:hypothetical protein GQ53DRAFT_809987 [Thozetella sp. PMI_491]|nr:hypothetical protein GQ53DRAFT_809987 [Thozetella sp. PMI_491]